LIRKYTAEIYAGIVDKEMDPFWTTKVSSEKFIIHEAYDDDTLENDIALIETPPIQMNSFVKKIALPYSNFFLFWQQGFVSGFGRINDNEGSRYLLYTTVHVEFSSRCANYYSKYKFDVATNVCIDTSAKRGACAG
jgi:hypothetical protein